MKKKCPEGSRGKGFPLDCLYFIRQLCSKGVKKMKDSQKENERIMWKV